ncbi:MAG: hypothetical protein WD294_04255, partial [Phycisphaeraceae bacterium]
QAGDTGDDRHRLIDGGDHHLPSILVGAHHRQNPNGYFGVGGIRGMKATTPVVIVDLPDDPGAVDGHDSAVVLAPRIVVGVEVIESRDGSEDLIDSCGAKASDTVCHHHDPASAVDSKLVVEGSEPSLTIGPCRASVDTMVRVLFFRSSIFMRLRHLSHS